MTMISTVSRTAEELEAPLDLGYRYIFEADELDAMKACVQSHGFAIAREVIDESLQAELQASVRAVLDPDGTMPHGESDAALRFVEHSDALLKLFDYPKWLAIQQHMCGGRTDLTVHRTAAILRNPDAPGMAWHTDAAPDSPWYHPGVVLNHGEELGGTWFYLNGCYPRHGGIVLMPDSHRPDWVPPAGFRFNGDSRRALAREDEREDYIGADIPGALPVVCGGRDMILFHQRTYHCALPNQEPRQRLSCAMGFRAGREAYPVPWPLTEQAQALKQRVRDDLKPYFEHYTSVRRPKEWMTSP